MQPLKPDQVPVIQSYLGVPVRFYEAGFDVEMRHRNDASSYHLKTWALPLVDYAEAVGYPARLIRRMIDNSAETFDGFHKIVQLPDSLGRMQPTAIMAVEMCDGLTMKLQTSRIKNTETRLRVIEFQRWMIIVSGMLRRKQLRPAYWHKGQDVSADYLAILSLPSGAATRAAVRNLASAEGSSPQTIYRRLQQLRGGNIITSSGKPKQRRSSMRYEDEYQLAMEYRRNRPEAYGREIKTALGLKVSPGRINAWIRDSSY